MKSPNKRLLPFNNSLDEAEAIDAKITAWQLQSNNSKLKYKQRTRLALLISGANKAACELRILSKKL